MGAGFLGFNNLTYTDIEMDLESTRGMEAGAETVYGTHEDSYVVMSEKVIIVE